MATAADGYVEFILFDQQIKLLTNIFGEKVRFSEGGAERADLLQFAKCKVGFARACLASVSDYEFRITKIIICALVCRRSGFVLQISCKRRLEPFYRRFIFGN